MLSKLVSEKERRREREGRGEREREREEGVIQCILYYSDTVVIL